VNGKERVCDDDTRYDLGEDFKDDTYLQEEDDDDVGNDACILSPPREHRDCPNDDNDDDNDMHSLDDTA